MTGKTQLNGNHANGISNNDEYAVPKETTKVFTNALLSNPLIAKDLPSNIAEAASHVSFTGSESPSLPIPYRFAEAVSSLKALEASLLNVLINRKYGVPMQDVTINTDHATLFIMSTLLWTIDPGPGGENIRASTLRGVKGLDRYFPPCDKGANFTPYRNLATNIYECKDGKFYHFHNSLNPDPTLQALGLPQDMPVTSYEEGTKVFRAKVKEFESAELDRRINEEYRQAGTICYSEEEFLSSEHGRANAHVGLWGIHFHSNSTQKPSWWPESQSLDLKGPRRPLAGLKIVDLTRIIAAPCVTRSLAEMGASVMRVTSPNLPDVSSLHVDLNWGKWNCYLDLKQEADREKLKVLIEDADVVVQGYRPGVLDKFGFGMEDILKLVEARKRGIVYVRENCYGWNGPWMGRSGWQQISDAVSCALHHLPVMHFRSLTSVPRILESAMALVRRWVMANPSLQSSLTPTTALASPALARY